MTSFVESWIARFLFATISLTAFLGNSLVIWVMVKKRKIYLERPFDIFILNLALSDALAAVHLIFSRFLYLPPMPPGQTEAYLYCTFLWGGYILFSLGYVSVYTCLFLTIERWMAVVRPQAYRRFQKKQALVAVVIIWIWCFILNTPVFLSTKADLTNQKCGFFSLKIGETLLSLLEIIFTCLLPFTAIISLYTHIFYKLNRMPLFLRGAAGIAMKKRLTVIALVASLILTIGWLPTQISYSLDLTGLDHGVDRDSTLYSIFIMMTLVNCSVNPVLYGVFSSRCRTEYISALSGILPCFPCRNKKLVAPTTTY